MGAITDEVQHRKDVDQLKSLSGLCPVYQRHLSHHLRNSLGGIVGSADLARPSAEARKLFYLLGIHWDVLRERVERGEDIFAELPLGKGTAR